MLVALVIVCLATLATAALDLIVRRNTLESSQRSHAAQLAYHMVERLRANNTAPAMRAYVDAASPWPARWVGRQHYAGLNAAAPCADPKACTGPESSRADLLQWEQMLDGAAEQSDGLPVGGLNSPTACITGPEGGGTGLYTVTISWRGNIPLPAGASITCGDKASDGGAPLYGDRGQYQRNVVVRAYIVERT